MKRKCNTAVPMLALLKSLPPVVHGALPRRWKAEIYEGPGIVQCEGGSCQFAVRSYRGCYDACHTMQSSHIYDSAFEDIAGFVSSGNLRQGVDGNGKPCYYKRARNIHAAIPDSYVEIESGCVARCKGCTFAKTRVISGPGLLNCNNGMCIKYHQDDSRTDDDDFNCGNGIEQASEVYGSLHNIAWGSHLSHGLYGYEGINTKPKQKAAHIPEGCTLDCSGCSYQYI